MRKRTYLYSVYLRNNDANGNGRNKITVWRLLSRPNKYMQVLELVGKHRELIQTDAGQEAREIVQREGKHRFSPEERLKVLRHEGNEITTSFGLQSVRYTSGACDSPVSLRARYGGPWTFIDVSP